MATQQTLAGLGKSNTNKRFKFVLSTKDDGVKTLRFAPDGWKESELTFIRDEFYKSVIERYSTNELTFVKDGRDFIQTAYERGGIDYEVSINIYILKSSTFQYQLYFSGKLDLSTYKIDSIGATCEVIPSGFQDVVLNRADIDVDMMSTKYIGGGEDSMEALFGVWEKVTIPEYNATKNADWRLFGVPISVNLGDSGVYAPMRISFSEYEGQVFNQAIAIVGSPIDQKFFKASSDLSFVFSFQITLKITVNSTPEVSAASLILFKNQVSEKLYNPISSSVYGDVYTFIFATYETLNILENDELTLIAEFDPTISYTAEFTELNISMMTQLSTIPAVDAPMFYIYEAFVRTIQLISGNSHPLKSDLLGRTDSTPDSYATDGSAALMAITGGRWIRGFSPNTIQLNFNLKDLFTTINAIHNIGLGFETISGNKRVRVEDEKYFFDITVNPDYATDGKYWQVNQILDLSLWLNNEMISKEVLPNWYANEIIGGYRSFEYENIQGLKEFNTSVNWAIPIKSIKTKLDIKADYRADTQGINKLREKPAETFPTEDVSGDNDIFIFDVKRGGDYVFTVKTNDDFESVSGGVDPQNWYNINFTPRRNLERHGARLRSMMLAAGDEIQWLKSGKNNSLITKKAGEAAKAENGDLLVNDLTLGYWIPEAYIFDCPVNEEMITALQANPRGVIKLAENKFGWILDVQTNNENKKGEFKLLRVNLLNVKII